MNKLLALLLVFVYLHHWRVFFLLKISSCFHVFDFFVFHLFRCEAKKNEKSKSAEQHEWIETICWLTIVYKIH